MTEHLKRLFRMPTVWPGQMRQQMPPPDPDEQEPVPARSDPPERHDTDPDVDVPPVVQERDE